MRKVLFSLSWLLAAAVLIPAALLLRAPSRTLYVDIASRTGSVGWTERVAEAGLVGLLALLVVAWWQTRRRAPVAVATLIVGGLGTAVAYVASEAIKSVVRQGRGCWDLVEVAHCPAAGDWSFPSNHTTVAFALAATAILVVRANGFRLLASPWRHARSGVGDDGARGTWWFIAPVALATVVGVARVAQGAHYPHDVLAGAVLGVCVVTALVAALRDATARGVQAVCRVPAVRSVLRARPY